MLEVQILKKRNSKAKNTLFYIVIGVVLVVVIVGGIWFLSGQKSPAKAAKKFVEAWANYDIAAMKEVSTEEMSDGMDTAYFQSILSSIESMRQVTADSEGIPVASVEDPLKWTNWKLHYKTIGDNQVEVTGSVVTLYSAYDDKNEISRNIHWIISTEKNGNDYFVSGVKVVADTPQDAVLSFLDALMSRNMFYVKKVISSNPDDGLANFLASMDLEFTQGFATKGLFFVPVLDKNDVSNGNKVHVSYTRVGVSSSSSGSSSLTSDVVLVNGTFTCSLENGHYVVKDVSFQEVSG